MSKKLNTVNYNEIGKRIKYIRTSKKMSQLRLAELCGLSNQHISNIENAKAKLGLGTLLSIANALNCSADELLCDNIYTTQNNFVYCKEIDGILSTLTHEELKTFPIFLKLYKNLYKSVSSSLNDKIQK